MTAVSSDFDIKSKKEDCLKCILYIFFYLPVLTWMLSIISSMLPLIKKKQNKKQQQKMKSKLSLINLQLWRWSKIRGQKLKLMVKMWRKKKGWKMWDRWWGWPVWFIHLIFIRGISISLSFPGWTIISAKRCSQRLHARLHLAVGRRCFASTVSTKPRWYVTNNYCQHTFWETGCILFA